jgi:leader peptidase (prepilin peptidase)/N-methyltransferase
MVLEVACGLGGLLVGVVLPVVIDRVPSKQPLGRPPFPEVVRSLRTPTGLLVVLVTGGLFAATAARLGGGWDLAAYLVFMGGLIALTVIDLRLYLLPNRIVFPLALASVALLGVAAATGGHGDTYLRALACGSGAFVAFATLHVVSPRAMGFGDVKLAFVLGLLLGWLGVGETLVGLFLGFVYGAVVGVVLIVTGRRARQEHVPFGPFLAAGAVTAVLVGNTIVDWYRR